MHKKKKKIVLFRCEFSNSKIISFFPTSGIRALARLDLWCCVCVDKMSIGGTIKFEIPKFNGKNFAMWKVKMHAILVKVGCAMALKGKSLKPVGMTDIQFEEKDEIAKVIRI